MEASVKKGGKCPWIVSVGASVKKNGEKYPWIVRVEASEKKKGKSIPLQAWTGPEGSIRLRFPDFMTIGTCRW